jgi:hypothetical protein
MTKAPQAACIQLGETGCYFLSIIYHAESILGSQLEPLAVFAKAIMVGTVGADAYVKDAGTLMTNLTGKRWTCLKAGPGHELPFDYEIKKGELEILRFEKQNPDPKKEPAHFVVGDGTGKVLFDPMGYSITVASGKMVSRRIFRRLD